MTKREQPEVTKIAVIDIETLGKGAGAKIASIGCAMDLAVDEIKKMASKNIEAERAVSMFDKAINQIAAHVGACCAGIDVDDCEMPGYSHTAAEIIRKIDELKLSGKESENLVVEMARAKLHLATAELKKAQAEAIRGYKDNAKTDG